MKDSVRQKMLTEPNYFDWIDQATGYECEIKRHDRSLHYCGYVGVPKDHVLFRYDYDSVNALGIDVHGGLTFSSDPCSDSLTFFGFDCAHLGDYSPGYGSPFEDEDVYRDFEFVKKECERLAHQLFEIENIAFL